MQGPYEIALQSLETYYSFPNIDKGNNKIRVSIDGGTVWNDLTFAVGCYEYKHINKELQRQVEVIGGKSDDVILLANKNTFQSIMIIKGNVQVDLTVPNSIRTVLGFNSAVYKKGRHLSEHNVNIMQINSIFVHTDVIGSTYRCLTNKLFYLHPTPNGDISVLKLEDQNTDDSYAHSYLETKYSNC